MRKRILFHLIIGLQFIGHFSFAQITFQRAYESVSHADCLSAQQTSDGGYIMVGSTASSGIFLVKTNSYGDTTWTKLYDSGYVAWSVQQTNDGGYIMAGTSIIKTDSSGNVMWEKTCQFSGGGFSIQQTQDGGFILCGYNGMAKLRKLNSNGDIVWSMYYTAASSSVLDFAREVPGGYIAVGYTRAIGAGAEDIYLVRTDYDGNLLWSKTYGGTGDERSSYIQATFDGYIIAGYTNSFGAGGFDSYLIKTDLNGDLQWSKTYGNTGNENAYSVRQTAGFGYILSGTSDSYINGSIKNIYTIKTNSVGDEIWSNTYGYNSTSASTVQQTADGGYMMASGISNGGFSGFYFIKTDANGYSGCSEIIPVTIESAAATIVTIPPDSSILLSDSTIIITSSVSSVGGTLIVSCSSTTSVKDDMELVLKPRIYPNPAHEEFNIAFNSLPSSGFIQILNMQGELIVTKELSGNAMERINLKGIAAGIYIVRLNSSNLIIHERVYIY